MSSSEATWRTGPQTDHGLDRLAPIRVGHADRGRLAYRRMLVEDVLDLPGPDLVAGDVDLVLFSVHQIEPAVCVHEPDVTRPEPPAGDRLLGLVWFPPVAGHHLRPRRHDFPDLADGQIRAVVADDAAHRVEDRHAHREGAGRRVDGGSDTKRHAVRG